MKRSPLSPSKRQQTKHEEVIINPTEKDALIYKGEDFFLIETTKTTIKNDVERNCLIVINESNYVRPMFEVVKLTENFYSHYLRMIENQQNL